MGSGTWVHPVKTTHERSEVEVPSSAVTDTSSVSADTSVSRMVIAPAGNSLQTLRTFSEDTLFEETCTVGVRTNSSAGSGDECTQTESAGGSSLIHRERAHAPSLGSSIAVDLTVDLAYGSKVFVIADKGALLDMAQTEFSGHRIGVIAAHVGDLLGADDNGGVLSCGKRTRTVPDDMKPGGRREGRGVSAIRPDRVCGFSSRVAMYVYIYMPRARVRQEGAQYATRRLQREQAAPLGSDPKRASPTRQYWRVSRKLVCC